MEDEVTLSHEEIFIGGQLLDVKLRCLELSISVNSGLVNPEHDNIVDGARKFFEFILEETGE